MIHTLLKWTEKEKLLKYGFCKMLHRYKWTSDQLNVHSKLVKKWWKKCSTSQRFICIEVTSYKIHISVNPTQIPIKAYCPLSALKYVRIQHETTSTNVVQSPRKDFGNDCKNTKKKTRHNRGDLETQAFSNFSCMILNPNNLFHIEF